MVSRLLSFAGALMPGKGAPAIDNPQKMAGGGGFEDADCSRHELLHALPLSGRIS